MLKFIFKLITAFTLLGLITSCSSNDDEPIKLDDFNGTCKEASYIITGTESTSEGTAKIAAQVTGDSNITLYIETLKGQEYHIKLNKFDCVKEGADLSLSSNNESIFDIIAFYKGKKQSSKIELSNLKFSFNGMTKSIKMSFDLDSNKYSYKGRWNRETLNINFGQAQYIPTPIERMLGRSDGKSVYFTQPENYQGDKRPYSTEVTVSLGLLEDESVLIYFGVNDILIETMWKLDEWKIEEDGDLLILKSPKNKILKSVLLARGGDIANRSINTKDIKFIYNTSNKEFKYYFKTGMERRIIGTLDTSLPPYTEIKSYVEIKE